MVKIYHAKNVCMPFQYRNQTLPIAGKSYLRVVVTLHEHLQTIQAF